MDKQKKEELAEMDSRWNFKKTVEVPNLKDQSIDWEDIRQSFNSLQSDQGDLYMQVDKMPEPKRLDKVRQYVRNRKVNGCEVIFHHSQIYGWFNRLAFNLEIGVGEAVFMVLYQTDKLRDKLELGETVNVNISSAGDVAPAESKVGKDELQELIEDD